MKFYTKEWYNNYELKSLAYIFTKYDRQRIIVICDDSIQIPGIKTIKPNLELPYFSDKEKKLRLIAEPVHFPIFGKYDKNSSDPRERSFFADFKDIYNNRLRSISLLPEHIQCQIEDKRLLALGYASRNTKKLILSYIKGLANPLNAEQKKFKKAQKAIEKALKIQQQIQQSLYSNYKSLNNLLVESEISNLTWDKSSLHIEFDGSHEIVLTDASILEEDASPIGGEFFAVEVHQFDDHNELHLLLRKRDNDLIEQPIYATYRFKEIHLSLNPPSIEEI